MLSGRRFQSINGGARTSDKFHILLFKTRFFEQFQSFFQFSFGLKLFDTWNQTFWGKDLRKLVKNILKSENEISCNFSWLLFLLKFCNSWVQLSRADTGLKSQRAPESINGILNFRAELNSGPVTSKTCERANLILYLFLQKATYLNKKLQILTKSCLCTNGWLLWTNSWLL